MYNYHTVLCTFLYQNSHDSLVIHSLIPLVAALCPSVLVHSGMVQITLLFATVFSVTKARPTSMS